MTIKTNQFGIRYTERIRPRNRDISLTVKTKLHESLININNDDRYSPCSNKTK